MAYLARVASDGSPTWDGRRRVTSRTFPEGDAEQFAYDAPAKTYPSAANDNLAYAGARSRADSNPAAMTWPDGAQISYAYDPADRFQSAGIGSASVSAGYDSLSRVDALTRPSSSTTIGYDAADRMVSLAHVFSPTTGNQTWTLAYTPGGELAQSTSANAAWDWQATSAAPVAATANGLNQAATVGGVTQTYDKNGNLTSDGVRTFSYDPENRLLTESGPATMALSYDPTGRLEQSVINGATTQFLYDGDALVTEYSSAGAVLRRYVHGPEVDNPLIWFRGAGVAPASATYLIADRQGSVAGLTNASGPLNANYTYDPYGVPGAWGVVGTAPRFRYTGQIAIPEAQLYYYKARVYDPVAGRFLQTDPVGDESDLNLYAYVKGNPVNATDSSGEAGVIISVDVWDAEGTHGSFQSRGFAISVDRNGEIQAGTVSTDSTSIQGAGVGASVGASVFTGNVRSLSQTTHTVIAQYGEVGVQASAKVSHAANGDIKPSGPVSAGAGWKGSKTSIGLGIGAATAKTATTTNVAKANPVRDILTQVLNKANEIEKTALSGSIKRKPGG